MCNQCQFGWELFRKLRVLKGMNRVQFTLLLFSILGLSILPQAWPQINVQTNIDVLAKVADMWAILVLKELPVGSDSSFVFIPSSHADGASRFIEDRFIKNTAEKQFKIIMDSDSTAGMSIVSIIVQKAGIQYTKTERDGFLGSRIWICRKAEIQLSLQLINGDDGRIQRMGDTIQEINDRFPASQLAMVEQGGRLLGHPSQPQDSGFWRWLEPAVALSVLGSVAYLFYSVRSR